MGTSSAVFATWSSMCLAEDMINTLDDCDLLEKFLINNNNLFTYIALI